MMQRSRLFFAGIVVLACAAVARADSPKNTDGAKKNVDAYEAAVYKNAANETLPYRLLKPANIGKDKKEKYPLVLFLHGIGERGDDNAKQLVHGMSEFARPENRQKYPCFVVAPQCPVKSGWVEIKSGLNQWGIPLSKKPTAPLRLVLELVDALAAELPVDANRIYITGLSMGGFGAWDAIARRPDLFAAAVPICGGGDPAQAPKLKTLPIWAFHGEKDPVVSPSRTTTMIEAIRAAGGRPKMTLYADAQHDSWTRTYANPDVLAWLFAQRKSQ